MQCSMSLRSSYPKQNVSSTLLFLFLLVLRVLLCAGFILSVFWTGVHVCTPDMFVWNLVMVGLNLLHAAVLTYRFLPPALSVELTELYVRMFKPLKVSSTLSLEKMDNSSPSLVKEIPILPARLLSWAVMVFQCITKCL